MGPADKFCAACGSPASAGSAAGPTQKPSVPHASGSSGARPTPKPTRPRLLRTRAQIQLLLAVVVIVVVVGSAIASQFGGGSSTSGSSSTNAGQAHVAIIEGNSTCKELFSIATIRVFVGFRNDGDAAGSIDVTPWRRYSDGSVNDSVLDEFTVDVPAHGVKETYADYGFDSTKHDLVQCGVILNGDSAHVTPLRVEQLP
jgi:hypothetical protein